MSSIRKNITQKLEKRKAENAFRFLFIPQNDLIDFASNDYLGMSSILAKNQLVIPLDKEGVTGSRLVTGTHHFTLELEDYLARFYQGESALIFNSGYDANIGVLSAVLTRHHVVLVDEYIHASIKDGIKLSDAKSYKFKHNDLYDLEVRLRDQDDCSKVLVVVESVYSMDGDRVDLKALVDLKKRYGFEIMLDEAHSTGLFGQRGEGLACELGLQADVFIRLHTFGKAMGCHGAVVLAHQEIRDYLINFSRPFIYTTGMSFSSLNSIKKAHDILSKDFFNSLKIRELCGLFNNLIKVHVPAAKVLGEGPIFSLVCPGNSAVKQLANQLQKAGFDVRPILSPTVAKGSERLRIIIHAFNQEKEIEALVKAIEVYFPKAK